MNDEAHRHACLVAYICNLPDLNARRRFLGEWELRHGKASADALRADVQAEWDRRRG